MKHLNNNKHQHSSQDLSKSYFNVRQHTALNNHIGNIKSYVHSIQTSNDNDDNESKSKDMIQSSMSMHQILNNEDKKNDETIKINFNLYNLINMKSIQRTEDTESFYDPSKKSLDAFVHPHGTNDNIDDKDALDVSSHELWNIMNHEDTNIDGVDELCQLLFHYVKYHMLNPHNEHHGENDTHCTLLYEHKKNTSRQVKMDDIEQFFLLDHFVSKKLDEWSNDHVKYIISEPSSLKNPKEIENKCGGVVTKMLPSNLNVILWDIFIGCFIENPYLLYQCIHRNIILSCIAICNSPLGSVVYVYNRMCQDMGMKHNPSLPIYIKLLENVLFVSCLLHKLEKHRYEVFGSDSQMNLYKAFKKNLSNMYGDHLFENIIMHNELASQIYAWFSDCSWKNKILFLNPNFNYDIGKTLSIDIQAMKKGYHIIFALSDIIYAPNELHRVIDKISPNDSLCKTTDMILENPIVILQLIINHLKQHHIMSKYKYFTSKIEKDKFSTKDEKDAPLTMVSWDKKEMKNRTFLTLSLKHKAKSHRDYIHFLSGEKKGSFKDMMTSFDQERNLFYSLCNNIMIMSQLKHDHDTIGDDYDDSILPKSLLKQRIRHDKKNIGTNVDKKNYLEIGKKYFQDEVAPEIIISKDSILFTSLKDLSNCFE